MRFKYVGINIISVCLFCSVSVEYMSIKRQEKKNLLKAKQKIKKDEKKEKSIGLHLRWRIILFKMW